MDVGQLKAFLAVAHELHFGRAAERLHIAQPPLSRIIKQLETEMGTRLLDRNTRSVKLTTSGQALIAPATEVLEALRRAEEAVMHVPIETARDAPRLTTDAGADGCIAVGGGSTTGLDKAIALEYGTPIIALPTTSAGSEMTPVWGAHPAGNRRLRPGTGFSPSLRRPQRDGPKLAMTCRRGPDLPSVSETPL